MIFMHAGRLALGVLEGVGGLNSGAETTTSPAFLDPDHVHAPRPRRFFGACCRILHCHSVTLTLYVNAGGRTG